MIKISWISYQAHYTRSPEGTIYHKVFKILPTVKIKQNWPKFSPIFLPERSYKPLVFFSFVKPVSYLSEWFHLVIEEEKNFSPWMLQCGVSQGFVLFHEALGQMMLGMMYVSPIK